ncbi:unnamed protein product [Medioppia subpectinata]|uniref:RING-box protein 2 n=1 Tax=Medioppia subpectinata TaxID=1979941 RepID=A0A7R9LQW7_9ACAR|nr:unnamed protein product [Medioppia subpectinata]CAG2120613.1 unnamed protein product [Medioppia subpectinata]
MSEELDETIGDQSVPFGNGTDVGVGNGVNGVNGVPNGTSGDKEKTFVLKKWNCCAMWSWDCECDTCAICRVQVMDACLRCQSESRSDDCVVVWGECNHSFHNCCMSLWVQQNNRCPLCQQDWTVQRIGK